MTFEQFNQMKAQFLIFCKVERNMAPHTIRAYKADLEGFSDFMHMRTPEEKKQLGLQQLLQRYLNSLQHTVIDTPSIARKYSCFNSFKRFVLQHNIDLNITIQRPHVPTKKPVYLEIDQITYLLDQLPESRLPTKYPIRDKAMFELLYATGIRCCELVAIRWHDINMVDKTIAIRTHNKKTRIALFGTKAKQKINEYIKKERVPIIDADEPLFINAQKKSFTTRSIQRIIGMFGKFLPGNVTVTPHTLRHSFAMHLLQKGADHASIKELLGHAIQSSTEKYQEVDAQEITALYSELNPTHLLNKKNHP